jgi:hypothetical protein
VFASGAQQFAWALDDWRSDGSLFPEPPVEPWRGVPVDPRLQQFMRNALDDLTRPSAPAGLTARWIGGQLQVSVSPPSDNRVLGFVAGVKIANRWVKLCRGTSSCTGALPPGRSVTAVGAVNIDVWHRRSGAAYVVARRQP